MRYVCVHGHFYQPPRENPWLESIELQDSAYPYHDWNERINAECYSTNAHARILDTKNYIQRIANNYSAISFNVGPTLLSWMEDFAPEAYAAVIRADRESQLRFGGHGNAIAQVYNHMILPLAKSRDKETQILWGIADFEHRFGRMPEGMWLPETAVDDESLDLLAKHGIRYTILSPYQAKRWRRRGSETWIDATGGNIDTRCTYWRKLPSGRKIALFFYDGGISQAVAFERLLENGERFAQRLGGGFVSGSHPQLVHIATDGETYGHHHRFGEMALAYALDYIESREIGKLTNYGQYLEMHPPEHEAEIHENSAWSCSHGVGRWSHDCGCNTGSHWGWHQRWRRPLREALDWLRDQCRPVFESMARMLVRDPMKARDAYISVILDRSPRTMERFLADHAVRSLLPEQQPALWKLMEMERNVLLSYTSCGWFFDEISGIETVQILQYAARALELLEDLTGSSREPAFIERLALAKSNVAEYGDGAGVYRKRVLTAKIDLLKSAANYAIRSLFEGATETPNIGAFTFTSLQNRRARAGRLRLSTGTVRVESSLTSQTENAVYAALHAGDHHVTGAVSAASKHPSFAQFEEEVFSAFERADVTELIRVMDRGFEGRYFTISSLFRDQQREILKEVLADTIEEVEGALRRLYDQNAPLMRFLGTLGTPLPKVFQTTSWASINGMLRRALREEEPDPGQVQAILDEARKVGAELDQTILEYTLRSLIEQRALEFSRHPHEYGRLYRFASMVSLTRRFPFTVELSVAQNRCYAALQSVYPDMSHRTDLEGARWVARFRELAEDLKVLVPHT